MIKTLVLLLALFSTPVLAQTDEGHQHLGLYLRLEIGPAFASSSTTGPGGTGSFYGPGGQFGLSLGGALAENLILGGDIWGVAESNPSLSLNGQTSATSNSSASLGAVGPQLTYYFMPLNLFLSGSLGVGRLGSTSNGVSESTDIGVAMRAVIGKEWWVSRSWGLGLSGQFILASNHDASYPLTWTTTGISVVFSATYN